MYQNAFELPDNLTLEQLDEYARARMNETRRQYYARNPDKVIRNRLTSAANLLYRHGLIDDQTRAAVLSRV